MPSKDAFGSIGLALNMDVVNGVMRAAEEGSHAPEVAIVGQGTGGDFRKTLGLEHRLDKYLEAIASGRVRAIDVGRITYRFARSCKPSAAVFAARSPRRARRRRKKSKR